MTIKKRLARSNLAMFIIPMLTAAVLLLIGLCAALLLLQTVYLPRMGLSLQALHQTGEQIEDLLSGFTGFLCIYAGATATALLLSIALTNLYLTRHLFRHISGPLDTLTAGVSRIMNGDLDSPIAYPTPDEFQPACNAVDEMAARLKQSLEQQQTQQQQKQELIAGMSHDLKSPLTSIRAYTEALLDGVAGDEPTRLRYLQTIRAKEADIEAMVNRLFAFARMNVSEYPIHRERLPLGPSVRQLAGQADAEGLALELDALPDTPVLADRELLGRIVSNLLDNSRKYGQRDVVHVRISARIVGRMAELSFADDGPGVPEAQLPRLFDVFYRGDAARTAPDSGSGLGLAVVKRAAEQLHGSVRAETGSPGGLCVTVSLPLAEETQYEQNSDH